MQRGVSKSDRRDGRNMLNAGHHGNAILSEGAGVMRMGSQNVLIGAQFPGRDRAQFPGCNAVKTAFHRAQFPGCLPVSHRARFPGLIIYHPLCGIDARLLYSGGTVKVPS